MEKKIISTADAPAAIGPYSQAVVVGELVFTSGQIPIDPASGAVSSGFRESGYLPEAVINFLALLGWNPGDDVELMSMDDLIAKFDLAKCSKAGARFDYKKMIWFNHEYILRTPDSSC